MGLGIEIGLESGSGLEGAPRASRRREGGEVRARANLDFRARRPPLPHRAMGGLRQQPGGTPARVLVPNAAVRSGGAIGVGRAAAAWQRRRRSGARRPICTWWSIHAVAARRPRATGSVFGMNSRATRRAGELAAADPVHRARLGRRLELAARSRPELFSCGAPFGHELETAITHGVFPGRGGIRCAVGRLCDAP
jgi:hypothetical protein